MLVLRLVILILILIVLLDSEYYNY